MMHQTWTFAPTFTVKAESRMVVTVDFDMKGLPHRGRRYFINPGNQRTWSPEAIALDVAREVYEHAADCKGCGHGQVTIQDRIARGVLTPPDALEAVLFPDLVKKLSRRIAKAG
jgi:hypothetical protein